MNPFSRAGNFFRAIGRRSHEEARLHASTWEGLAAEVRSISRKDFESSWQQFLIPLQNIEKGKAMPGMVKLFSEMAERSERIWDDGT